MSSTTLEPEAGQPTEDAGERKMLPPAPEPQPEAETPAETLQQAASQAAGVTPEDRAAKPDPKQGRPRKNASGGKKAGGSSKPAAKKTSAAAKPKPAATAASGTKRVSIKTAAEQVLKRAGGPLHVSEITVRVQKVAGVQITGKTPEATVGALLAVAAKKRETFKRTKPGTYTLR